MAFQFCLYSQSAFGQYDPHLTDDKSRELKSRVGKANGKNKQLKQQTILFTFILNHFILWDWGPQSKSANRAGLQKMLSMILLIMLLLLLRFVRLQMFVQSTLCLKFYKRPHFLRSRFEESLPVSDFLCLEYHF